LSVILNELFKERLEIRNYVEGLLGIKVKEARLKKEDTFF
jgi:hypothetical protein